MLKIQKFDLIGNLVHNCQMITGGDRIDVLIFIEIKDEEIQSAILDLSQYNQLGRIPLKFKKKPSGAWIYSQTFEVEFLGEQGIECGRNDEKSKIHCTIQTNKKTYTFYSNAIGNADYDNFANKDHHLGVYTRGEGGDNVILEKLRSLSGFTCFPNDIIFKNRFPGNTHLIEIDSLKYNEIANKIALGIKNKAEFLIFSYSLKPKRRYSDIHKLLPHIKKIRQFTNVYFYNIPFCIFRKEGKKFIDEHVLYNAIFKINTGHASFDKCNGCIYEKICNQISTYYGKGFGIDEFMSQK